ncbi:MAG TPA: hypothetical protein VFS34_13210 [Thermoanaerobaculia bacterium]|nr:hypothetical protein [Thermoanaerobaculia bacterium]
MRTTTIRRRKAFALLGTMLFLLVAVSFHSAADNDLGRAASESRVAVPSALPGGDSCPACALDGLVSVASAFAPPVGTLALAERLASPIPARPFVAPRASVESRPPPAA